MSEGNRDGGYPDNAPIDSGTSPSLYDASYAFLEAYCDGADDKRLAPLGIELGRALRAASGTSGSAQDAQRLDPKGAGPAPKGGDAQ